MAIQPASARSARVLRLLGGALLALAALPLLVACGGGGGGGPTAPPPPSPGPPSPVTLFGEWRGTMVGTPAAGADALTCTVTWRLEDAGGEPGLELGVGDWETSCSDGTGGRGALTVNKVLFLVTGIALPASGPGAPFGGCGWGAGGTFSGTRIEATWDTVQQCPVRITGTLELRK